MALLHCWPRGGGCSKHSFTRFLRDTAARGTATPPLFDVFTGTHRGEHAADGFGAQCAQYTPPQKSVFRLIRALRHFRQHTALVT
jgi:hypothetical protein